MRKQIDKDAPTKCKKCGEVMPWNKIRAHHFAAHGLRVKTGAERKSAQLTPVPDKPLDALGIYQQARAGMKDAMLKIDDERQALHNRIRELDDLAAKLKPLL